MGCSGFQTVEYPAGDRCCGGVAQLLCVFLAVEQHGTRDGGFVSADGARWAAVKDAQRGSSVLLSLEFKFPVSHMEICEMRLSQF